MKEAQFGSSPDLLKEVIISGWERVEDTCAYVHQQEDRLKQPDQLWKDRFVLTRWT
jgi:hypothetical protein